MGLRHAHLVGIEPTTCALGVRCSVLLSYRCTSLHSAPYSTKKRACLPCAPKYYYPPVSSTIIAFMKHLGILYLIPVPLGTTAPESTIPLSTSSIIEQLDIFLAEKPKTARAHLSRFHLSKKIQDITILPLKRFPDPEDIASMISTLTGGKSIGILSEAGCPAVADPGSVYVSRAHQAGIQVKPLVGPTSIILGLMASGLNGQHFTFIGYLPVEKNARIEELRRLGRETDLSGTTFLFIETPYRSNHVLRDLVSILPRHLTLSLSVDLTSPEELVLTKSIADWQTTKGLPNLDDRQTIFTIGKNTTTTPQSSYESLRLPRHTKSNYRNIRARRRRG